MNKMDWSLARFALGLLKKQAGSILYNLVEQVIVLKRLVGGMKELVPPVCEVISDVFRHG